MAYGMSFLGRLEYPSELALERGLDALADGGELVLVRPEMLRVDGLTLHVEARVHAPASMWSPTLGAVAELAAPARRGFVDATFRGDGEELATLGPCERPVSGVRHRRWERLFAAYDGDVARADALLAAGLDPDEPLDTAGQRMLEIAVARDHVALAAELLARGARADRETAVRRALLDDARSTAMLVLLRSAGVSLGDVVTRRRRLLQAIASGRTEVALAWLESGATLDAAEARGALLGLVMHGLDRVWDALDAGGVELAAAWAAQRAAARVDDLSRFLGEGGSAHIVAWLVRHGCSFELAGAIRAAASRGRIAALGALLDLPGALAACGASSGHGDAMCRAASAGQLEAMALLETRGVPLHPSPPFDTSPLHAAAGGRHGAPALEHLIARGVPIEARSADGTTTLERALCGNLANAVTLLTRGMDLEAPTSSGLPAYEEMAVNDRRDLEALLRARGLPLPKRPLARGRGH